MDRSNTRYSFVVGQLRMENCLTLLFVPGAGVDHPQGVHLRPKDKNVPIGAKAANPSWAMARRATKIKYSI